jgi:peptidoglycan/xylan/chitin deacetylase (PgdA/CDA1 family)
MKEVGGASSITARSFFILTLAFSLLFGCILNANTTIGIDAFAKKNSKTSSSDRASSRGSDSGNGSRNKASDTTSDLGKQGGEPTVPLPVETPTNSKFVIINFDDSHQSDYTYAKPILDKYGFKATFFEVCNWIETGYHDKDISITWQQIAALQQDGMDIEAHTMTHPNLNGLSQSDLDYEIGQSKQCLENHGFNPTIFAYPNGEGSDDPKVVNTVAKYYDLARAAKSSALTLLQCGNGMENNKQQNTYCETYLSNGELTPANRYSINSWAHKHIDNDCSVNGNGASATSTSNGEPDTCKKIRHEYNNAQMFQKFVTAVNNPYSYNNKDGKVSAIPIIVYHTLVNYRDLSDSNRPIDTTVNLFDAEMKYLQDNGFKVLTMADLRYDTNSKSLYIQGT